MDKADVKAALNEALDEARKKFWVDAEQHYIHHQSIESWIKTFGLVKKSVLISFITGFAAGLIGIFWMGVRAYIKLKGHE